MAVEVIVAIIGAAQAVILALVARQSVRMKRVEADTGVVRENTQNSHEKNMRDDIDDKHEETTNLLREVRATQKEHGGAIVGLRQDLRHLREVDLEQGRDVADVRRTVGHVDKKLDEHLEWSRDQVAKLTPKEKP